MKIIWSSLSLKKRLIFTFSQTEKLQLDPNTILTILILMVINNEPEDQLNKGHLLMIFINDHKKKELQNRATWDVL